MYVISSSVLSLLGLTYWVTTTKAIKNTNSKIINITIIGTTFDLGLSSLV